MAESICAMIARLLASKTAIAAAAAEIAVPFTKAKPSFGSKLTGVNLARLKASSAYTSLPVFDRIRIVGFP